MRTRQIDIVFYLLENYSGLEIPSNTDIKNIFDCSFETVRSAIEYLEDKRMIINRVVEAEIVRRRG